MVQISISDPRMAASVKLRSGSDHCLAHLNSFVACKLFTPLAFTFLRFNMSSLRNSLHRRNHKERSQLAHRARLGILEKHKDYVLRARDYHSKQDRLNRLKQKAADRNKDEFYFAMHRQRTEVCAIMIF